MISLMKRLWSFGRKEKNKSKTSPHVSPRGSIKKRRESTKSVTSSTSSSHASIFTRDRSNSDAPQLSLGKETTVLAILLASHCIYRNTCYISIFFVEYCEKNLASLTTDDSVRERLSFDTKKLTSKKKNSLDIPLQRKLYFNILVVSVGELYYFLSL